MSPLAFFRRIRPRGLSFRWVSAAVACAVLLSTAAVAIDSNRGEARKRSDSVGLLGLFQRLVAYSSARAGLASVAGVLGGAPTGGGTARYVHKDGQCDGRQPCYSSIQAAIDDASSRDSVRVLPGDYEERLRIRQKNTTSTSESDRIIIEADPEAPVGSVVLRGRADRCEGGYSIEFQRSRFVTLRGLTIIGAGARGIGLLGGSRDNTAIHLERNRLLRGGPRECNGGIDVGRGNGGTVIANNLIYGNGRNGLRFRDGFGGSYLVYANTIVGNAWSGIQLTRGAKALLINNLLAFNGAAPGLSGGRYGVRRLRAGSQAPEDVFLAGNLICGNRQGELTGVLLDEHDTANQTVLGSEGPGVFSSATCGSIDDVFASLSLPSDLESPQADFSLGSHSPAIDRGLDAESTLAAGRIAHDVRDADYLGPDARPRDGDSDGLAEFDVGAIERPGGDQPTPSPHAPTVTPTVSFTPSSTPDLTPSPAPSLPSPTEVVNQAPRAVDDRYVVRLGATTAVSAPGVLLNDSDPEDGALESRLTRGPNRGTLEFRSDGSFDYTPLASSEAPGQRVFFGEDLNDSDLPPSPPDDPQPLATRPNADRARASFLEALIHATTETFESLADQDVPTILSFGTDVGILSGSPVIKKAAAGTTNDGGYAISGENYLNLFGASGAFSITFSSPQAAFGFYAIDIESAQFGLILHRSSGDTSIPVANTTPAGSGSVFFFGLIDPENPISGVTFTNSNAAIDGFGFDDMVVARADEVCAPCLLGDQFLYKASDGLSESNEATVQIAIRPANRPPVANDDNYRVEPGHSLLVDAPGVLANDSDADSEPLSVRIRQSPSHGDLALRPDGAFSYLPYPAVETSCASELPPGFTSDLLVQLEADTPVSALALGRDGAVYIADSRSLIGGESAIRRFDPKSGRLSTVKSGPPLYFPGRMLFGDGNDLLGQDLIVSDHNSEETVSCCDGAVFRINPTTGATTTLSRGNPASPPGSADDPFGLEWSVGGRFPTGLYVMDFAGDSALNPSLFRINPGGSRDVVVAGAPQWTTASLPSDLAFAPAGAFAEGLYISDESGTIWRYDPAAGVSSFKTGLTRPSSIRFGPGGAFGSKLYLFDLQSPPRIVGIDPVGRGANFATIQSATGHLGAADMVFDQSGSSLYVGIDNRVCRVFPKAAQPPVVDTFTYVASDGSRESREATVTIVLVPNQPPIAVDDAYRVGSQGGLDVGPPGLLENDYDAEGELLAVRLKRRPTSGTVALRSDGSFSYQRTVEDAERSDALYGITAEGQLISIDPETGRGALIGNTGLSSCEALADGPSSKLYAICERSTLYLVEASSGRATAVGVVGEFPFVEDLAVLNGVLYGAASADADVRAERLIVIDPSTGAPIEIGVFGASATDVDALSADVSGRLVAANLSGQLLDVDPDSGTGVLQTVVSRNLVALHLAGDGVLYGATIPGTCCGPSDLVVVDVANGAVTTIGPTGFDSIVGLARGPGGARTEDRFTYVARDSAAESIEAAVTISFVSAATPTPRPTTSAGPTPTAGSSPHPTPTPTVAPPLQIDLAIASPAPESQISELVDVVGTVSTQGQAAGTLTWLLERARMGTDDFVEIGAGTGEVMSGVVGRFDPTLLPNDVYRVRLSAFRDGRSKSIEARYSVVGELKLGNFTMTVTDLTIPVAGIPLSVSRRYDSLDTSPGDFGPGWRLVNFLDVSDGAADSPLGATEYFRTGTRVYVTRPDGRRVGFTFRVLGCDLFGICSYSFVPDPGVTDTLEAPDVVPAVACNPDCHSGFTADPFNPRLYRLTTKDKTAYLVDEFTGLVSAQDVSGNSIQVTPQGLTSSSGLSLTFERDAAGRITKVVEPDDPDSTEPPGSLEYVYDDATGNLVQFIDQVGNVTSYFYGDMRLPHYLTRIEDPLGRPTIRTVYDDDGRLAAICDANGDPTPPLFSGCTRLNPDAVSRQQTVVNARGFRTDLFLDPRGNVLAERRYLDRATTTSLETVRTYDATDNLLTETDPEGNVVSYTYDARGNQTSRTQGGHTTRRTYNECSRPLTETDEAHNTTTYEYNRGGCLVASVTDALGHATRYIYNTQGMVTDLIEGNGVHWRWSYDTSGFVESMTDPAARMATFKYSRSGDLLSQTDRKGQVISFEYDDTHRRRSETWHSTPPREITYGYNAVGQLTSAVDRDSSLSIDYDNAGRTQHVDNVGTPNAPHVVMTYAYDPNGNVTSVSDSLGGITTYDYDGVDRLISIHQMGTGVSEKRVDVEYDSASLLRALRRFGGVAGAEPVADTFYGFECGGCAGRMTEIRHVKASNGAVIQNVGLVRDAAGNVTKIVDAEGVHLYTYDARNQVTAATDPAAAGLDEYYEYDPAGNRLQSHLSVIYTYEVGTDRLIADDAFTYSYDANGNLTLQANHATGDLDEFVYDYRNRLVEVSRRKSDGSVVAQLVYGYDAANRRIVSIDEAGLAYHVFDRLNPALVVHPDGSVKSRRLFDRRLGGLYADDSQQTGWLLRDHVGSVRDVISDSAEVRLHLAFDSFGVVRQVSGDRDATRFGFGGREFDEEKSRGYWWARTYSPRSGRFEQEDLFPSFGYAAVSNNPVTRSDPTGLVALFELSIMQKTALLSTASYGLGVARCATTLSRDRNGAVFIACVGEAQVGFIASLASGSPWWAIGASLAGYATDIYAGSH